MQAYKNLINTIGTAKEIGSEHMNYTLNLSECACAFESSTEVIDWKLEKVSVHLKYFLGRHYPGRYLTQREAEVLSLIPNRTYKEIAGILQLSHRTIQAYARALMTKLSCKTKRELNTLISEHDFIEPLQELIETE
jgi:DNA-binding CsgD family transcriptional regulator